MCSVWLIFIVRLFCNWFDMSCGEIWLLYFMIEWCVSSLILLVVLCMVSLMSVLIVV